MRKIILSAFTALTLSAVAAEAPFGVVNFATCVTESKAGKKEQENMESIRNQMSSLMEQTEKELKEISAKFEDTEYLDSLSPKAEEELKVKFQTLQEDLSRYQNQFYQVMNHANYQMVQKMSGAIGQAAKKVAEEKHLTYVFNKEACFFVHPDLDFTSAVVSELDKSFDEQLAKAEEQSKKVAENKEVVEAPKQ